MPNMSDTRIVGQANREGRKNDLEDEGKGHGKGEDKG